jgi:hypothetical protein
VTNPGILLDAVVDSFRGISELATDHLDDDSSRVLAYRDRYATETNLQTFILNASKPSIVVAYMGMVPGDRETMDVDDHKFAAYLRAPDDATEDHYYGMMQKILDGNSTGGVAWRYSEVHENCYPPSKIQFKRIVNAPDKIDLWELSFVLTEYGG